MKKLFQSVGQKSSAPQPDSAPAQPEKTAAEPEKTAAAPEKTAAAPEKTAAAPEKTASAAPGLQIPTPDTTRKPGDTVTVGGKTYTVVEVIGSGAEGDIYVVTDNKRKYALKLCHKGFKTNEKVLRALEKIPDKEFLLPRIEAWGPDFELMEYIPGGSVAKENLKGNAEAILAIITRVAFALDAMHKAGVIHKDIKPANILIRGKESWDVVLCDFGIADIIGPDGSCTTSQARTRIYAAPEVYAEGNTITIAGVTHCELTSKADFYSLGMTILSLWMGESAFMAKEPEMALDKVKGRIAIPPDMPDPLARICRGLLIRNPEKRWNLDEIEKAISGKEVEVEEDLINEDLGINYNASKHLKADTPEELAACMADDLDLASRYLYRGQVEKWLKPYPELALEIQDITENRYPHDHKAGVQAVIFLLDPATPLHLKGFLRDTGEETETDAVTLKDVSNFCCKADLDSNTAGMICTETFRDWVRIRSKDIAAKLPTSSATTTTYLLRIQTIDPLSDINLINNPEDPDYAMTGEGLGRFLNEVYTVFWNTFEGDINAMLQDWENGPMLKSVAVNIAVNFLSPDDYHYVTEFLDTKNGRFDKQRQ
ncbi:MAG: protein kinase, partial [Bacteroidales bacterium]|nr:protein kinase [Bacteroidales bacterium]